MSGGEICRIVMAPGGDYERRSAIENYRSKTRASEDILDMLTRLFTKPPQKPIFIVWWEVHRATLEGEKIIAKSESFDYEDKGQLNSKFSSLIAQLATEGWEPFATNTYGRIEQMKRSGKSASAAERLKDLEGLHKGSLISDEEYGRKRQEILSGL